MASAQPLQRLLALSPTRLSTATTWRMPLVAPMTKTMPMSASLRCPPVCVASRHALHKTHAGCLPSAAPCTRSYSNTADAATATSPQQPEQQPTNRMIIGFTCNVCSTRQYKSMSKQAYTQGVVIIKCDGCKSLHLIADHLGWFDSTQGPVGTIEDIMAKKGETVVRVEVPTTQMQLNASSTSLGSGNDTAAASTAGDASSATRPTENLSEHAGMLEWIPKAIAEAEAKMNSTTTSSPKHQDQSQTKHQ